MSNKLFQAPVQLEVSRRPRPSVGKSASVVTKSQARKKGSGRKSRQVPAVTHSPKYKSIVDLATPVAHVSAFCQAVLSNIIPNGFWGSDSVQTENKALFLKKVDRIVHLRRFEQVSLHDVMQGMKVGFACYTP